MGRLVYSSLQECKTSLVFLGKRSAIKIEILIFNNNEVIKIENKWKKHEDFIEELLNLLYKFIWVDKLTQYGFTTSSGKVFLRKGLKFTHLAPTNRIISSCKTSHLLLKQKVVDG